MVDFKNDIETDFNLDINKNNVGTLEPENESSENTANNNIPTVNCLALTIRKDYNLTIFKNVVAKTFKNTWRIALSVFILNFLTSFL